MKFGEVISIDPRITDGERPTVLVVEDDPALLRAMCTSLGRLDVEVLAADDGYAAIRFIDTRRLDLICVDLMLPDVSGFTVLEHVRATRDLAGVPVMVTSGRTLPEDRARALDLGAREYLVKPYFQSVLRQKVQALLAETRRPRRARRLP